MGGAVFIDGRAAQATLDPAVQNWDGGIAYTVQDVLFYRNFASFAGSAQKIVSVWPAVIDVRGTDYIENDAMIFTEHFYWPAPVCDPLPPRPPHTHTRR